MSKKKSTLDLLRERKQLKPSKELLDKVKEQAKIKSIIIGALKKGPKTVPELSREVGLPTDKVMWYLMTFRKYGDVEEDELAEDYWRYKIGGKK